MVTIEAIDHGYWNTKDHLRKIFKSTYSRADNSLSNKNKIIINGETYYFGVEDGIRTGDVDKTDNLITKITTLADLAMNNINQPNKERILVVGLPISQYNQKKDKLAEIIMQYNECEVIYQGKKFNPNIKDVCVFAQGVGSVFNIGIDDGEYISFDIGSYTINVVLVEIINGIPYIKKYNTWYDGIMILFDKIIKEVNKKYDLNLGIEFAERILTKGLSVYGEIQNTDFLKPILRDYLENIFSKFKPNYPHAITPILLSGGGANLLGGIFVNCFNNSMVLPDAIYANVIGYRNFGLQKYGYLLEGRCRYA